MKVGKSNFAEGNMTRQSKHDAPKQTSPKKTWQTLATWLASRLVVRALLGQLPRQALHRKAADWTGPWQSLRAHSPLLTKWYSAYTDERSSGLVSRIDHGCGLHRKPQSARAASAYGHSVAERRPREWLPFSGAIMCGF